MNQFLVHSIETAPEGSKETLKNVKQNLGGIPNLAAAMAESPSLVKGFFALRSIYTSGTFSDAEIQVLSLTNAMANRCEWCVAFHSFFGVKAGVSSSTIERLRNGQLPEEPRLQALSRFSSALIEAKGRVSEQEFNAFLNSGFTKAQALEVVVGIAFSTMANFAEHLTQVPLEAMFAEHRFATVY
ncbi:MAG: carboxymuconolactone decarboxylase family protein [Spirochaetia bacterium]|nr:carboxymuconolactone decarboxylase family protein [Spirochaetia bacterium]